MSLTRVSRAELEAEAVAFLPDKEVCSLLDLNVLIDLGINLAAPIDLAVAANANVAAPINAAVSANVLAAGSESGALASHDVSISQHIDADAVAHAPQHASISQGTGGATPATTGSGTAPAPTAPADSVTTGDILGGGPLLDVNVHATLNANLAAPIAGAVAANANVAAPINAAASANVGTLASSSMAIATQHGSIEQTITGAANATADQTASVAQQ